MKEKAEGRSISPSCFERGQNASLGNETESAAKWNEALKHSRGTRARLSLAQMVQKWGWREESIYLLWVAVKDPAICDARCRRSTTTSRKRKSWDARKSPLFTHCTCRKRRALRATQFLDLGGKASLLPRKERSWKGARRTLASWVSRIRVPNPIHL